MTWSSKQQLNQKDLSFLRNVLLHLSMKLSNMDLSPMDTMNNSNSMIPDTTLKNIENDILINLENG